MTTKNPLESFEDDLQNFLKANQVKQETISDFLVKTLGLDPNSFSIGIGSNNLKFRFIYDAYHVTTSISLDKEIDVSISKRF